MKYNNEFRVIDTQEKAYFLGFMYGDGTISSLHNKFGKITYSTRISVQIGDISLINKLKEVFGFLNIGKFDYSKYNENSVEQVYVRSSSKKLHDDLMLNGLYPRKSYENKDKLKLPDIDDELMSHFIRGFFDADGSVYTQASRKNLIRIEFTSVSKSFINQLNNYLIKNHINSWRIREKPPIGKSKQICFTIEFIKTSEVLKLIEFMYKDANIKLERKADKCLSYKPVNKVKDRSIECPKCGSNKVWVNGQRSKSMRYQCQTCFKGFSIKNVFN
jgi:predicted RNA-binding Zn-ribbon protein involved in translation (DUF1610 family)